MTEIVAVHNILESHPRYLYRVSCRRWILVPFECHKPRIPLAKRQHFVLSLIAYRTSPHNTYPSAATSRRSVNLYSHVTLCHATTANMANRRIFGDTMINVTSGSALSHRGARCEIILAAPRYPPVLITYFHVIYNGRAILLIDRRIKNAFNFKSKSVMCHKILLTKDFIESSHFSLSNLQVFSPFRRCRDFKRQFKL
jgi:hypothetical protein